MARPLHVLPQDTWDDTEILVDFLKNEKIHPSAIEIIQDQLIDGSTLIDMDEKKLIDLGIKAGPARKIINLMRKLANQICSETSEVQCQSLVNVVSNSASAASTATPISEANKSKSVLSENSDLEYYDVRAWVKDYDKEKNGNLEMILDDGVFPDIRRQLLVRVAVGNIMKMCSENQLPSSKMKLLLAKSLLHHFPKLNKRNSENAYEMYYNPKDNSGFIQNRIKTMRKGVPQSQKKRKIPPTADNCMRKKIFLENQENSQEILSTENYQIKVIQLENLMPNDVNKTKIFKLMDETRINRQLWIKSENNSELTLHTILKTFPRLLDFNGELILREFDGIHEGEDDFIGRFSTIYVPRIIQFCSDNHPKLLKQIDDITDGL